MRKWYTALIAVVTAAALCVMPACADVVSGGVIGIGLLSLVVIIGVIALLAALLVRLVRRKRQEREDGEPRERK